MTGSKITLSQIRDACELSDCDQCKESGCSVRLDRMPDRVVFKPEQDSSDEPMADCCIFFPEKDDDDQNQLYRNKSHSHTPKTDYLAITELKSTIEKPSHIMNQIEGALDFAIDIIGDCEAPPWNITCFCIVMKNRTNTYNKSLKGKQIVKNIDGETHFFRAIPVDSDTSLRDLLGKEEIKDTMSEI